MRAAAGRLPMMHPRRFARRPRVNVLADEQYQWFYWLAPILVASIVVVIALLSGGYVRKVLIPRVKGRRVE